MRNKNKLNYLHILLAGLILFSLISTVASAETVYDVNGDGKEGLAETIHSLQVTAGLDPATVPYSFSNSAGMTFSLLPADTFAMGSPDTEPGSPYSDEQPEYQVILTKSFYMQITEVTNGQWDAVITDKGRGLSPSYTGCHTGDKYPVCPINWYEAASFSNWLSSDEGLIPCYNGQSTCSRTLGDDFTCTDVILVTGCTGYRLPTEAKWEYASRATTTTDWPYAESYDTSDDPGQVAGTGFNSNLDAMGWYIFNNTIQYATGTKPVARKQANKWGLYDMQGNVYEWCQDRYDDYSDDVTDPQGPTDHSVIYGLFRVIRGGTWRLNAEFARSANREGYSPGNRNYPLGFRLVLPSGQ